MLLIKKFIFSATKKEVKILRDSKVEGFFPYPEEKKEII